jgi:hypothetical protein
MLARTPIVTLFFRFVASREPMESYNWSSFAHCACGQFVREEGIDTRDRDVYRAIWGRYEDDPLTPLGAPHAASLNAIAYGDGGPHSWTFGALRQRLDAMGYGG